MFKVFKNLFLFGLVAFSTPAFAADPAEIIRCTSDASILSVRQIDKGFAVSFVTPLTLETLKEMLPGVNLDRYDFKKLLEEKPANLIPERFQQYDKLEMTNETIENGFRLSNKTTSLSFVKNELGAISIRILHESTSRFASEAAILTQPFGPSDAVVCQLRLQ